MKTNLECIPCMLSSVLKLYDLNIIPKEKNEIIFKKILRLLSKETFSYSPPKTAQVIHRIIRESSGIKDPYKKLKQKYNKICLDIYEKLKIKITGHKKPLYEALKLSIVGNIIDFGPNHKFNLIENILRLEKTTFSIDHSKYLFEDIKKAKTILYIGDNAGEIVFDKLFIETLNKRDIYFAVRGKPVINDATLEDAEFTGINKIINVIEIGKDIPGVDLENSSKEFKYIYNNADLIISKGQGNFESLCDIKNKNIYFLLMAKCNLVAKQLNVNIKDIVVKNNLR